MIPIIMRVDLRLKFFVAGFCVKESNFLLRRTYHSVLPLLFSEAPMYNICSIGEVPGVKSLTSKVLF